MQPRNAAPPSNRFNGVLSLVDPSSGGRIDVLKDTWEVAANQASAIGLLPPFSLAIVQDGSDVIPLERGPQPGHHPYWEFIPEPGKAWDDPGTPGWTRISMPFSLQERNQNCVHNGMLTFLFRDAEVSHLAYQVVSETCQYLKADLWGVLEASYEPREFSNAPAVAAAYHDEVSLRLPVRPITALADDFPDADPVAFRPPNPSESTVFGFVIDGVHYRGGCDTRFGPYPFCDVLDLPSYSVAKSVFAGLALLHLEKQYPGFADMALVDLVPECRLQDGRWSGVTLWHLLNMTTGNYDSPVFDADESAAIAGEFFLPETHAGKLAFSCNAHPRKSPPGTQFVYHTWDTYLLGTAMNAFWKARHGPGADLFRDVMVERFWKPLGLSPVARTTRRTYDEAEQPFTGYGLTLHPNDVARIGQWLVSMIKSGEYGLFDSAGFEAAMFRDPDKVRRWVEARGEAYSNGFWALDLASRIGCPEPAWIPFMSGYGGINVALIPNGTVYYDFEDGNQYRFTEAVAESHRIRPLCEEQ